MIMKAGLLEAFERMPMPQIEFLDDTNLIVNCMFAGLLGGSVGVLLYVIISELIRYFND